MKYVLHGDKEIPYNQPSRDLESSLRETELILQASELSCGYMGLLLAASSPGRSPDLGREGALLYHKLFPRLSSM